MRCIISSQHFESTYLARVVTPAKSYCLFEYIKDSERVAVAA